MSNLNKSLVDAVTAAVHSFHAEAITNGCTESEIESVIHQFFDADQLDAMGLLKADPEQTA